MPRRVYITALAQQDLADVWLYSAERWNVEQAERYLDQLQSGIEKLTVHPNLGASRKQILRGYRVLLINQHAIYYVASPARVDIIRVLHKQLDVRRNLFAKVSR